MTSKKNSMLFSKKNYLCAGVEIPWSKSLQKIVNPVRICALKIIVDF